MDVDIMQAFRLARRNGRTGWTAPVARPAIVRVPSIAPLPVADDWTWDENGLITF